MVVSRRKEIIEFLVERLKEINGQQSIYDASYIYKTNLFNNVFRQIKFLDEINDFPALYLAAGTEIRNFQSQNLTVANLDAIIRAYVYGEDNSQDISNQLVEDIEHIIYNIGDFPEMGILDITIESVTNDEGLAAPYGIAEIELQIVYRLEF
jgi:hypothetical protein